jgi:hypothetical protein
MPLHRRRLASATRGRISELIVQQDLLERGWEVFAAVSPSCKCDLVIHDPVGERPPIRVEVKTTVKYRRTDGSSAVYSNRSNARKNVFEVLAVVDGFDVKYEPEMPTIPMLEEDSDGSRCHCIRCNPGNPRGF